jgi:hypothetical protein
MQYREYFPDPAGRELVSISFADSLVEAVVILPEDFSSRPKPLGTPPLSSLSSAR